MAAVLEQDDEWVEGACDVSRKYFADGAFSPFLPSVSWSSSKTLIRFSLHRLLQMPAFRNCASLTLGI